MKWAICHLLVGFALLPIAWFGPHPVVQLCAGAAVGFLFASAARRIGEWMDDVRKGGMK